MAPNGPGAGYDGKQGDKTSNREANEPGRKEQDGGSGTLEIVPVTGDGPEDPAIHADPPVVEPDDPPTPEIDVLPPIHPHDRPEEPVKDQPKDPGNPGHNDQPEEHVKDQPKDEPKDRNTDEPRDKEEGPKDKQCKKDGRDNVNSQGNHDCSADHPDPRSGQERTTDHGQNGNSSNDQAAEQAKHKDDNQKSPDKECKNAGSDNVNSQGNRDCSADNPDTSSDQERTTDHGQSDQAPGNDHGNNKGKKD
jgi:hypothetical protein